MSHLLDIAITALLVIAGSFGLIGSFGLVKLRGAMQRLHAPTKASTVGVGAALMASVLAFVQAGGGLSWNEWLVTGFLFLTAPLTALYLAKTQLHRNVPRTDLPPTGTGAEWASFDQGLDHR